MCIPGSSRLLLGARVTALVSLREADLRSTRWRAQFDSHLGQHLADCGQKARHIVGEDPTNGANAEAVSICDVAGIDHEVAIPELLVEVLEIEVGVIGIAERRDDVPLVRRGRDTRSSPVCAYPRRESRGSLGTGRHVLRCRPRHPVPVTHDRRHEGCGSVVVKRNCPLASSPSYWATRSRLRLRA